MGMVERQRVDRLSVLVDVGQRGFALRADVVVLGQLRKVQDCFALGAFTPETIGNASATVLTLDTPHGGHNLI